MQTFFSRDLVINLIGEFKYIPEEGITFATYFRRYFRRFTKRLRYMVERKENTSVARKIWSKRTQKVCEQHISEKSWGNIFLKRLLILKKKKVWRDNISLFNTRWQSLKLTKKVRGDYSSFAGIVNRECEKFEFTSDVFKCLIFVQGLTEDGEIKTRILSKLE